jgi:hypothetical protein
LTIILIVSISATSAGGDEDSCDATLLLLMPIFGDFATNLTDTGVICAELVDERFSMNFTASDIKVELENIHESCNDFFIGFLMEVVERTSELLTVDANDLLDIIVGGKKNYI